MSEDKKNEEQNTQSNAKDVINKGKEKTNENDKLNKVVQDTENVNDTTCDDVTDGDVPNLIPNPHHLQSLVQPLPPLNTARNASSKSKKKKALKMKKICRVKVTRK